MSPGMTMSPLLGGVQFSPGPDLSKGSRSPGFAPMSPGFNPQSPGQLGADALVPLCLQCGAWVAPNSGCILVVVSVNSHAAGRLCSREGGIQS